MKTESARRIIKRIRLQDLDRSQERWGEELGVSRVTIANWESGVAMPDAKNLAKVLLQASPEHRLALLRALAEDDGSHTT